jgi:hypothetical protein
MAPESIPAQAKLGRGTRLITEGRRALTSESAVEETG